MRIRVSSLRRCIGATLVAAAAVASALIRVPLRDASLSAQAGSSRSAERSSMVDTQLSARGIRSRAVLEAMRRVPRHLFVPPNLQHLAYADMALPIASGQTISQPFIVAYMTEALDVSREHSVLEIGTGSGYQAAVLAELGPEVYSIEIVPELAERARQTLAAAGYSNVRVRTGNGFLGWPEQAPFPRIIVTAAPEEVPPVLIQQLAVGGRMVLPVGATRQELRLVRKTATGVTEESRIPVRFVPMVNPR